MVISSGKATTGCNPVALWLGRLTRPSSTKKNMFERTIIIGDLHGCYNSIVELMDKCKITTNDRVIFLGDLVDRGPDSAKCVELAMKHECILGNHEEKHLRYFQTEMSGQKPNVAVSTHIATREQLTRTHYEYLRTLPLYIRLPEYNLIAVHAGMYPGRRLEQQTPKHLMHLQMIRPPDEKSYWPSKVGPEYKFWTHFWKGPERIVFGHTVLDKPLRTEWTCGIDGGGVFGRELHALILTDKSLNQSPKDWEIVSVSCDKDYGKGRRGTSSEGIKLLPVHGDVSCYS